MRGFHALTPSAIAFESPLKALTVSSIPNALVVEPIRKVMCSLWMINVGSNLNLPSSGMIKDQENRLDGVRIKETFL